MNPRGGAAARYGGGQNRVGNVNPGQARPDLALNVDNVFQADDCDAFDSDMDEAPTAQTMFMANLSFADPVTDEARPSHDSDILSEDNEVPVVHSNVSTVSKDAFMIICNDIPKPYCLTHAKQVQPPLYNGHEIIKYNHAPAIVHNTEDTLEIADITRKKMNDKIKNPEYVTRKVKIAPHDYSKENFLAIFTPQKQLTPEQIFLSNDLIKLKSKALKEQTTVSRPIKALTVKHDAVERKNLLIVNDNLIAECLSKEVFYVTTNSELNVARLTEMHIDNTLVEARFLALEAELANLCNKSHHDNQEELINHFSKLEVNHLDLQLKYQNLKDSFGNNPPTSDTDTLDFDSVFVIGKMQTSLQGKENVIRQLQKQISQLQVTRSDTDRTLKVRTADSQITKLTKQITNLQANNLFRAENDKIKQHTKNSQTLEKVNSVSKDQVKPKVLARGKYAIDVELIFPRLRNNRDAHLDYLRHLKENVETICDIVEEAKVVRPLDRSSVCACRYTEHSQELLEYAIGTCPQGSQQRAKQLAHIPLIRKKQVSFAKPSDKSQPKSNTKTNRISPAKCVNKLSVEDQPRKICLTLEPQIVLILVVSLSQLQFCDSDLEVAFRKHYCYVRDTDGVELIKGSRGSNLYTISIEDMMKSSPICLLSKASKNKSWLWNWRLNYLNFDTINDLARKDLVRGLPRLKFEKDHLCSTCQLRKSKKHTHKPKTENTNVEVLTTACYTQNRSLIHTRHHMTTYELVHNKKPDLTFFRVFGALCYPTKDSEDLGKLQPTADIGIFVGYAPSRKGSGLVPNLVPATPIVPPTNKELEILFQPMFDEYLEPPPVERSVHPTQPVQALVNSAAEPHYMEDHLVAPVDNNPFVNVFAPEPHSEASSFGDISSTESTYISQTLHHLNK
nr:integrase, catalytic region, zinc finger, CCHC-type, peptidase aspartic, catalytic [Tanacetum cinerariifolium]